MTLCSCGNTGAGSSSVASFVQDAIAATAAAKARPLINNVFISLTIKSFKYIYFQRKSSFVLTELDDVHKQTHGSHFVDADHHILVEVFLTEIEF